MTDTLTQKDVDRLIRHTEVLAAGMSNMWGTYLTPGAAWAANPDTGEIIYDLGLAAVLDEEAQRGVALHEIGHLRFTASPKKWMREAKKRWTDERDLKWAHYTVNLFEDCRIERLMVEEFPGAKAAVARLRAAWSNETTQNQLGVTDVHMQFLNGLYCVMFGLTFTLTDPKAVTYVDRYRAEALDLVYEKSTMRMARGLFRPDGILEALLTLRDSDTQRQQPTEFDAEDVANLQEGQSLQEAGKEASMTVPDPDAGGAGGSGGAGAGMEAGATGESGSGMEAGGAGGSGGAGAQMEGGAPGEGDPTSPYDVDTLEDGVRNAVERPEGLDRDSLAMTEAARELLQEALNANVRDDELEVPARRQAEGRLRELSGARTKLEGFNNRIEHMRAGSINTRDDLMYGLEDDFDAYDKMADASVDDSSVLGRQMHDILSENRVDRWGGRFASGGRINPAAIPMVKAGDARIFRRQTRAKNRAFAVSVACDLSGSMRGERLRHATLATVLIGEACERVTGLDFAMYGYSDDVACFKSFDRDLNERAGKIGNLARASFAGRGTQTGRCVRRMGEDLLTYDDDWRKLLIVVTDGQSQDPVGPIINTLSTKHDVLCVGVGIKTMGSIAHQFPAWVAVDEAYDVAPALTRILRRVVTKG